MTERIREALEEILSRSCMNLAMNPNPYALTALLGDIHQIAGAALAERDELAKDAARWRYVESIAKQSTAYDRYGRGAHWSIGVFSDDSRQTFGETIDEAMKEGGEA